MNHHMYARQQEKNALMHHGIKGQKWGIRRYQNPDGTLTPEGRKRYNIDKLEETPVFRTGLSGIIRKKANTKDYMFASTRWQQQVKQRENELYDELLADRDKLSMEEFRNREDEIFNMSYKAEQEGYKILKKKYGIN